MHHTLLASIKDQNSASWVSSLVRWLIGIWLVLHAPCCAADTMYTLSSGIIFSSTHAVVQQPIFWTSLLINAVVQQPIEPIAST